MGIPSYSLLLGAMLECKDLSASVADVATVAGEWAATAAAKAWGVTSLAAASAATLAASVARRVEKADWKLGRQQLRSRQCHIVALSGLSVVVSLGAIHSYYKYLNSIKRPRLVGSAPPEDGDRAAPPPPTSSSSSAAETLTKSSVPGRELELSPEDAEQASIGSSGLGTPVKARRDDCAVASSATTIDSPDSSFETEPSADGSIFGDVTVATTDPDSAKVRVKELNRMAKSFARQKKFAEAADSYTEALGLLETLDSSEKISSRIVSLLNSRSLVYEQAGLIDLAIDDCQSVLARGKGSSPMLQPRVQKRMMRLQQLNAVASVTPSPKNRSPLRLSFFKKVGFSPSRAGRAPKATPTATTQS